jgi:hypothetical protein
MTNLLAILGVCVGFVVACTPEPAPKKIYLYFAAASKATSK